MKAIRWFLLLIWVAVAPWASSVRAADELPVFKMYVEHTGVYEISFDRLEEIGLDGPVASARMGLRSFGEPVVLWIEDGGDGLFGPGDRALFMGRALRGDYSYLDPFSRFNCYVLDFADPDPWRGETRLVDPADPADPAVESAVLKTRHHLEPDRVMVRFRSRSKEPEEAWYWDRLSVGDKKPFTQEIALDGLIIRRRDRTEVSTYADAIAESVRGESDGADRIRSQIESVFGSSADSAPSIRIRLGLRGWSEPRHAERMDLPHHQLDIELNDRRVGSVLWDGKDHYIHEFAVPAEGLIAGANELTLTVPKRLYPRSGDLLVDVVLLNWIELEYDFAPRVGDEQVRLRLAEPNGNRFVSIDSTEAGPVEVYLPTGVRWQGNDGTVSLELEAGVDEFSALRPSAAAIPNEIVLDRRTHLADGELQADYIMITHRSLLAGVERLAEFHRSRGLTVAVVDVQDIYDEFNYSVVHPRAIKDFLQHAHTGWREPAPRFVLLVGDASWDFKNTTADDSNYADWTYRPGENRRFWKNRSTAYAEGAELNHRNLVPTSSYVTLEGHAASDTWFVCFDDGDNLPDMAIGRIPVVSPEELDGVVDKTIAFASAPPVGPWRRNLLFIANESVAFQKRSDRIAEEYGQRGYVSTKIYPHPSEPANEHHTRRIIDILDDGVYAVHFIGHGGRYIWRTGPPDLEKNHDLFTLEHLDRLADSAELPVVLSLTCYSAPFDHPTADSIGEKLMRIPRRGAVSVFAASWRNSPSPVMGDSLLAELTTPGNTIGEAVTRAKQKFGNDVLIQTYNLLGDPAVPVGAAENLAGIELDENDGVTLRARSERRIVSGMMMVDWVATDGSVVREDLVEIEGLEFELSLDPGVLGDGVALAGARVYVWDEDQGIDGIGWVGSAAVDDEADQMTDNDGLPIGGDTPEIESKDVKGES